MSATISVLIPTYNGSAFLAETLDAVLAQSFAALEVLVMDDGSTEAIEPICARYGERVRYFRQENAGICRTRNELVGLSRGRYLAFCDHDDLWKRNKLERQIALHQAHPEVEYSFTDFAYVIDGVWDERSKLELAPEGFFAGCRAGEGTDLICDAPLYRSLLRYQPVWPSTVMLTRRRFDELGGFREEFGRNPSEDFEFTLRNGARPPIGVVRETLVGVRRHPLNFSRDNDRNIRGQIEILQYALIHHGLDAEMRRVVEEELNLRSVELSCGAFQRRDYHRVVRLLEKVPGRYMDWKVRTKLEISRVARLTQPETGAQEGSIR